MKKEKAYNEAIDGDEGFAQGDGYPSCDGEPCVNVSDKSADDADTMAENGESSAANTDYETEIAAWRDKYVRLQAEFDNYRKRTLREKMELVESGGANVLKAVLPVADDMKRAMGAAEKSDDICAIREGIRLIASKCDDMLRKSGVSEIEAKGAEFDLDRHEAVAKFAAGKENKGKVVDVIQTGYMLGDKVLRFAKVVVGE